MTGTVVILNGVPRAGKSSIAAAIQASFDGIWMNLGVDVSIPSTPPQLRPGIGLRPGGERPDIEVHVPLLYAALYESVLAHARLGLNVVTDVDHHDWYREPRGILADVARRLDGIDAWFVGVRCPIEIIAQRRDLEPDEEIPAPWLRWQEAVHDPGIYDLEVDTSLASPEECAAQIAERMRRGPPPAALRTLTTRS
jgi:chloramphenicol 3-O phosphotransferase